MRRGRLTPKPTGDPAALALRLLALPVAIEALDVRTGGVALADYEGGLRPSGLVALSGRGVTGFGEHVGFSAAHQRAFAAEAAALLRTGAHVVGEALNEGVGDAYARAAMQAAVIDLAMRQAGVSLAGLTAPAPATLPLRWVASFAAADPVAEARALRAAGARGLKIDVDPAWSDDVLVELGAEPDVVTLDFKDRGSPTRSARLRWLFPAALFEDPPPGYRDPLCTRDRPLLTPADVAAAVARGEGINVKCPRLGGPVAALRSLVTAAEGGVRRYFGGMYEVGPGRAQARQLAALFCGEAPNDLGPIGDDAAPDVIDLSQPGFGATRDWRKRFDRTLQDWPPNHP